MFNDCIVITSFNEEGYEEYGIRFIESFIENWGVNLLVYYEGGVPKVVHPRIFYKDIFSVSGFERFILSSENINGADGCVGGKYNYLYDARKFSRKAYAISDSLDAKWKIWIDADVFTFAPVTAELLRELCQDSALVAYLGRDGYFHTESGFMAYNQAHSACRQFLSDYKELYDSHGIFHLKGWTDCHAFDFVRSLYVRKGASFNNLTQNAKGLDVFEQSLLGGVMRHFKGGEKKSSLSGSRYNQIYSLIEKYKPSILVEIGTWNGRRAIEMGRVALQYSDEVVYMGYDLFEDASDETDRTELNVKRHFSVDEVMSRISSAFDGDDRISFSLIKGNTRTTLSKISADFVFIDGGHSVDTILSDYMNVSDSEVIVLDDYYTVDEEGRGPDTGVFGCNKVVDELEAVLLPIKDRLPAGGYVQLALVVKAAQSSLS